MGKITDAKTTVPNEAFHKIDRRVKWEWKVDITSRGQYTLHLIVSQTKTRLPKVSIKVYYQSTANQPIQELGTCPDYAAAEDLVKIHFKTEAM